MRSRPARQPAFRVGARCGRLAAMNDDQPKSDLETLKAEHRLLDERIGELSADSSADQLEIARLKKRKLILKDKIQRIVDSNIPDIIA